MFLVLKGMPVCTRNVLTSIAECTWSKLKFDASGPLTLLSDQANSSIICKLHSFSTQFAILA